MISEMYQSFIFSCIRYLETHPPFAEKTKRLKSLTKVESTYLETMSECLLEFFCAHEVYHKVYDRRYYAHEEKELEHELEVWIKHYENRCKIYIFDVIVEEYEQRISRTIQVPHDATVGTLGQAVIASLQGENREFYMSHGEQDLYMGWFGQKLHFTESDPYETKLEGFCFGNEPFEMLWCGLHIHIQLKEIRMLRDIYEPQSYVVLSGTGLNLPISGADEENAIRFLPCEDPLNVPMDIRTDVEAGIFAYESSFLVPYEDEPNDWEADEE